MIGLNQDFAAAGARSSGLSVIAHPLSVKGAPTLVEQLPRPVTTASHDVEVVVTDRGVADLHRLGRTGRRRALRDFWEGRSHGGP